ncbi:hypothetical protein HDE_07744 [Halotydeus destructor]|nr:hypothetical protein HDE_07744 [Halotydeus destructor]
MRVPVTHQDGAKFYKRMRVILLFLLVVNIILALIAAFEGVALVEQNVYNNSQGMVDNLYYCVWFVVIVYIVINLFGFASVYGEHYHMTERFALTMTVLIIPAIISAAIFPMYSWGLNVVNSGPTTIMALYVSRESMEHTGGVNIVIA